MRRTTIADRQLAGMSSTDVSRLAETVARKIGKVILDELEVLMDEWMTSQRVADMLGCSVDYVNDLNRELGGIKVGRRYLFSRRNINLYLALKRGILAMPAEEQVRWSLTDPMQYTTDQVRHALRYFRMDPERRKEAVEAPETDEGSLQEARKWNGNRVMNP